MSETKDDCPQEDCPGKIQKCAECEKEHRLECGDYGECMYCKIGDNPQIHCQEHLTKIFCPHSEWTFHMDCNHQNEICADHLTIKDGGYVPINFLPQIKAFNLKEYEKNFTKNHGFETMKDILTLKYQIEDLKMKLKFKEEWHQKEIKQLEREHQGEIKGMKKVYYQQLGWESSEDESSNQSKKRKTTSE